MAKLVYTSDLRFGLPPEVVMQLEDADLHGLAEHCYFLYGQAYHANTELEIFKKLLSVPLQFERDVICASCFFGTVCTCLVNSVFMNCARLYDDKGKVSLGALLELMKKHAQDIDERARALKKEYPSFDFEKPILHALTPDEERFYQELVDEQRKWENLAAEMSIPVSKNTDEDLGRRVYRSSVSILMTSEELVGLWVKRLNGLNRLKNNLRKQRNEIFAHNGLGTLSYEEFIEKVPLKFDDMQKLIDFALDVTIELNRIISGIYWPRKAGNVGDVEGMFRYIDLGMKAFDRSLD